jgi:voltage-gated potassium channel
MARERGEILAGRRAQAQRRLARARRAEQRARAAAETRLFLRRLGILLAAVAVLIAAGTVGFALAEHVSVAYALLWTVDTVTTLGTIPEPHDTAGRLVILALELLGIGTLFYGLATVAEFFVSGQLSGVLQRRRMQNQIDSLSGHFIVCGYGRVGRQVGRDLNRAGVPFLTIDENPDTREIAQADGVIRIESEAADDEVLTQAGIARARGVIACVDSDAENIFITLTARELRADILILARASAEDSEKKLLRAGADRVISPYKTSGSEMARTALHPQVAGSVEVADYRMDEIEVPTGCAGAGRTVGEVQGSSTIVAMWRVSGRLEPQPAADTVIGAGDKLVALGTPDALERLEALFEPAGTAV